ncbi:acyl carrier protein [Gammaproteobacteria bacterium 42_54_T18]|nr:acyl carrier protein [Gammaproteobacteria bacterium 42_54_T18]
MSDIKKAVYALIAQTLEVKLDVIDDELAVGDIQEWDSLGHMRIIAALETEMGITLDIEQTLEIEDVEDIIDAVTTSKLV